MAAEEKIIDRIRKLLEMTEDNGCTPEEAALAWSRVQKLMTQHAIEEEDLVARGVKTREAIIRHAVTVAYRDEIRRQKVTLIGAIAKANHCRVVDATRDYDQVWIVGHETDAMFVEIMAASVLIQYAGERTKGWADHKAYGGTASRFRYVASFAWGYMERIHERLTAAVEEAGTGKELVLADRKALVSEWMSENLSTKKAKSRAVQVLDSAARAGEEAANKADLSGGRNHVHGSGARELN